MGNNFHKVTVTESVTSIELRLLEGTVSAQDAVKVVIKKTEFICSSNNCRNNFHCNRCKFNRDLHSIKQVFQMMGIDLDDEF